MESYSEGPVGGESKLRPGVEATKRFTLIIADRGGSPLERKGDRGPKKDTYP